MGLSFFYKNFSNIIVNTQNPGAGGNAIEREYENVPNATIFGIELELRKSLGFITPLLQHFKLGVNRSLIYSAVLLEEEQLENIRFSNPSQGKYRKMRIFFKALFR